MRKYIFTIGDIEYKRVNKQAARKAYISGENVILCPCKLRPGYPWNPEITISGISGEDFDSIVSNAGYYSLSTAAGSYMSYYIHK